MPALTVLEVREYLDDYPENNHLGDNVPEFRDTAIQMAMNLAVDEYNALPPISRLDGNSFENRALHMQGTLWKLYEAKAASLARNHMSYSDGGIQIPIEERYSIYLDLASKFQQTFLTNARNLKTSQNMEEGWGNVFGDQSLIPYW